MSKQEQTIIEDFFSKTTQLPCEIFLTSSRVASTRFSNNAITQNVEEFTQGLSLRILDGVKTTRVSSNQFSRDQLDDLYYRAVKLNEFSHPDEELLPLYEHNQKNIETNHPDSGESSPVHRAKLVSIVVDKAKSARLNAAGIISTTESKLTIANNCGLFKQSRERQSNSSISMMSDEGSGWSGICKVNLEAGDIEKCANKSISLALKNTRQSSIEPGEYTVILEPAAVADLIRFLSYTGFNGLAFVEDRSFMSGKLDEKIMDEKITIFDDIHHLSLPLRTFDFEGVDTSSVTLIDQGIAKAVVHDRSTAFKTGGKTTGHSLPQPNNFGPIPRAVIIKGGSGDLQSLIKATAKGILVTRFHYTNLLDPLKVTATGMTRDGLFLVEQGQITTALKNMRFTESILKAFNRISAIGNDHELFWGFSGYNYVPSMKIANFHFSSRTEF
ncbi:MAG: TldD/PmbA family protein [bacterium]